MTIGIYRLIFNSCTTSCTNQYIGQSINIEERYKQHLLRMKSGTATQLLQNAYDKYGEPQLDILITCHPSHLDYFESFFYNAVYNKGFDLNTTQIPILFNQHDLTDTDTVYVDLSDTLKMLDKVKDLPLDYIASILDSIKAESRRINRSISSYTSTIKLLQEVRNKEELEHDVSNRIEMLENQSKSLEDELQDAYNALANSIDETKSTKETLDKLKSTWYYKLFG